MTLRAHLEEDWRTDDFIDGAEWAAAWVFALVGMAEAIRRGRFCVSCGRQLGALAQELCGHCASW